MSTASESRELLMVIASNALLIVQGARATRPARPDPTEAATTSQDAGAVAPGHPEQPAPPHAPRTFTIRGPRGEQTIIGMPPPGEIIPPQAVDISIAFFVTMAIIIIGLPLARAFARRMDRKGGTAQISNEVSTQLAHLNQAVDAIAVEVERISEGQRFTTRLLSEQRDTERQALPSGTNR